LLAQKINIKNLFFYLLILFLPTQLGRHFWPDFSFVSGIRVDYLAPTLYVTDILILLLFITWTFSLIKFSIFNFQFSIKSKFKNLNFSNISNSFQISNFKFQISFLLMIILIGILLSKNQLVGFYGLLKLVEFIFLGFYTAFNIKKLRFDIVLLLFSIGIIFEFFLAILQYLNQRSIGGIFYFLGERTFNAQTPGIANASLGGELFLRPYGAFPHPNVLAGYLLIAMTLILSGIKSYESRIKKIVFILTLTIGTIALFLTLGRIAIVVWVLILGFFIVRKFLIHNSYFLILLIVVFLFLGLTTPLGVRFTDIRLTDESIVVRQELIKSSLLMVKNNPFFGVGLNNFLIELPDYQKIKNYFTDLQPVHNIFLLVAAQTGIVGLIFFLWFIGKTYKRIMNHESRIRHRTPIIHNSKFIILSTALVLGFFDHYFLTLQQGQLLFSFILGFCWSKSKANVI